MIEIDSVYEKGILFVRAYGVINKNTKEEINKTLKSAINEVGIKYLLLNLEYIYYINCEISSLINKWSKKIKEKGGKFFICGYDKLLKEKYIEINDYVVEMKDEVSVFNIINI